MYWEETRNGSTCIKLILPPEMAQAYLNSVEHSLNQLDESDSKLSQRRADAAVLMAENSLQSAGREIAKADRYQVVVSVDASMLTSSDLSASGTDKTSDEFHIPPKRPTIKGAGPIALETARRISCDCSISVNKTSNGEPIDIGRKSRIWPAAMARAIKERDQHCQHPGCGHTKNLQIHHVKHWADGGTTSVENSYTVCAYHHTLLHEGGYTVQRVEGDDQCADEQFARQKNTGDTSQFDFEKTLRRDRDSFNTVRKLSPTRYRFRVLDANGYDIRDIQDTYCDTGQDQSTVSDNPSTHLSTQHSTHVERDDINEEFNAIDRKTDGPFNVCDSTHVGCAVPASDYLHCAFRHKNGEHARPECAESENYNIAKPSSSIISELPARYDVHRHHASCLSYDVYHHQN